MRECHAAGQVVKAGRMGVGRGVCRLQPAGEQTDTLIHPLRRVALACLLACMPFFVRASIRAAQLRGGWLLLNACRSICSTVGRSGSGSLLGSAFAVTSATESRQSRSGVRCRRGRLPRRAAAVAATTAAARVEAAAATRVARERRARVVRGARVERGRGRVVAARGRVV